MRIVEGMKMTLEQALEVAEYPDVYVLEVRSRALRILGEFVRQLTITVDAIKFSSVK